MSKEQSRKAAQDLLNSVNSFLFKPKEFAKELGAAHRTLQQSVMRAAWAFIEEMAKKHEAGDYDLRNQDAVELAKKIVDAMADEPTGLRFI